MNRMHNAGKEYFLVFIGQYEGLYETTISAKKLLTDKIILNIYILTLFLTLPVS